MRNLALCCLIVLFAGCSEETVVERLYDTAEVEQRTIEVSVSSAGVVEPLATVEVKSKASGEVLELHVANGDFVESGALMALIDPRTVRNRLAQAEAELKAGESRRSIARTQMERAARLLEQGTFTEADVEQATLDLANAEAQVVTAQVSVENARIAVDDTDIRPEIGIAAQLRHHPGVGEADFLCHPDAREEASERALFTLTVGTGRDHERLVRGDEYRP